ncbi:MAG: hypothetical protein DMG40_19330 [Acidobacteria bacterium]|nr:MAG: hypothetical protein DMG40_19330 [Acidobacteriota bacterium]
MASGEYLQPPAQWDADLPTLRTTLDPGELSKYLYPIASTRWRSRRLKVIGTRLLNWHKGSRYTFEITATTDTGWHNLIGKVYSQESFHVFDAMKNIWRVGLDRDSEFAIPEPLAYVPELRLLLQEKVTGQHAKEVFLAGSPAERAEAAERCGRWLMWFQLLAPQQGKGMKVRKLLRRSERRLRHIVDAKVPLASKAEELFQRLLVVSSMLEGNNWAAGHGDYSHYQILFSGKRTVTFNWDAYDTADPCRDAARFVVSLERLAMKELTSIRDLDVATRSFLNSYLIAKHPRFATRLGFYRAVLYLKAAKRDVMCSTPGGLERAKTMLEEGLSALDQNDGAAR